MAVDLNQVKVLSQVARALVADKANANIMHRERFDKLVRIANSLMDAEEQIDVYQKMVADAGWEE